ncbi:hypothetical protein [Aliivibrio fischeri]|uniref:hypothetical protein n=1 Tax=Aliivibrio fischeri TaxID=668 RepID=UPI0012DABD82|nr:hypothetical protein [Aliivibrio fischeri]MUK66315.1 hypothetical protein [Aliivibrio fischeri]
MLIYALSRDTNKLEHIDSVPNGLKCNCFCSGCNDALVAKNNCSSSRSNHFSHYSKDENRNCLMTQLHLAAQHHFLNAEYITLPEVSFLYKDEFLTNKAINLKVHSAQLETKIDRYYADVTIETEIGTIAIEICVTHKNEHDKTAYYQQNKIASIEYDLSSYLSKDIDEAIKDLNEYAVESTWLYEWCRDELIQNHNVFLAKEKVRMHQKRQRSAKLSMTKLMFDKIITLPDLTQYFKHKIGGTQYSENVSVFTQKEIQLTEIFEVASTQEYSLLKGNLNKHIIWIAFLLERNQIPDDIAKLSGSVIIQTPSINENEQATWSWLKYPRLARRIEHTKKQFINRCKLKKQLKLNVNWFLLNTDNLYKKDYQTWSNWMKKNKLSSQVYPKLSYVLRYKKEYSCLWMFNSWHILTLSYLTEIIDSKPQNSIISYRDIFDDLALRIDLHEDFLILEQNLAAFVIKDDDKSLIIRESIIEEALLPFRELMQILCLHDGCKRINPLMPSLSLGN